MAAVRDLVCSLGKAEHASDRLVLTIDSPDLDMGFPGRCQARVSFQLSPDAVNVQISAAVDQACPLNLIQHNYWNLDAMRPITGSYSSQISIGKIMSATCPKA